MTGWVRSSLCNIGGCIEVKIAGGRVEIRDSNRPSQTAWFREADWLLFVTGVKAGEFDVDGAR